MNESFSTALEAVKQGKKAFRAYWENYGQVIYLVHGSSFEVSREPLKSMFPEGREVTYKPHIDMICGDGQLMPYTPTQSDLLAEDWYIVG